MFRVLLIILLMCAPGIAIACECIRPIRLDQMRASKHVVALRVVATGVPPKDASARSGIALVEVLDRLRGDASPARLRYSLGLCCPMRIEAGNVYLVFTDAPSRTIDVNFGNLVVLPKLPVFRYDVRTDGRDWRAILTGKRGLPAGFEDLQMQWLFGIPPPPPPPG